MMNAVVVDTDVVSYAFRGAAEYEPYEQDLVGKVAFISFMTWAELMRGALARTWGEARRNKLAAFIKSNYAVINSNEAISRAWGELSEEAKSKGRVIQTADAWIAATAVAAGVPLLSNNRTDFDYLDTLQLVCHASK
ncbi:MAG: PIN domain-containing protein [Betaproteobacteria bacterium]